MKGQNTVPQTDFVSCWIAYRVLHVLKVSFVSLLIHALLAGQSSITSGEKCYLTHFFSSGTLNDESQMTD